jgi:hypothetical protein
MVVSFPDPITSRKIRGAELHSETCHDIPEDRFGIPEVAASEVLLNFLDAHPECMQFIAHCYFERAEFLGNGCHAGSVTFLATNIAI